MSSKNIILNNAQNLRNKTQEKVNDTFNIYEYKSKDKCTYFQFGDIAIEQDAFCCEICDPNKTEFICEECYNTCHKNCRNDEEESSNVVGGIKRKFFCECGLKKHEIEKQKDQDLIKACLFGEIDTNMGIEITCFCKTCKIHICYICSKECHKQKNGCELQRGKLKYYNYDRQVENVCECKTPRHSNKTSMIRIINKFIDKEEYGDTQHIWRLQLFNNFCMSQIFSSLFFESQSIINNFTVSCVMRRDYFNLCDKFVRLGKLILKSQKYFYFKTNYVNLIPYKYIINVIASFKPGQYEKFGNYICSLCFFFYFIHLKRDFQNIKGLCIIDFFISSPLDRLFYRKLLHSKTIYTNQIYDKYFDETSKTFKIANICNQLLEVLDNAIIDFSVKKLDKCLKNFFTILKICFFCLKRYLFDMSNLKKFIDIYLKIALNIYHYVDNCMRENKTGSEFAEFLETLMYYLTRINICLVFNYNDLIIENHLNTDVNANLNNKGNFKSLEDKLTCFNYYNHETSKKLLRILIITSTVYGTFTMNNININKEHLNQLNILLETYILTNNVYSINLKSITPTNFKIYFNRTQKIKSLVNLTSLIKKKKIILSKLKSSNTINDTQYIQNNATDDSFMGSGDMAISSNKKEEYILIREIGKPEEMEDIEFCLRRNIFNLKEKIEANYDKFFQYKMKIDIVMKELTEDLKSFCENEKNILNKGVTLEFPNNNDLDEEFSYNLFLKRKYIKNYQKKMKLMIQEKFSFISFKSFNSLKIIQCLIDELILSSFDTTITKIFFMDKSNRLLSQANCNIILNFLYIYCLTEDGLKNFCLGRNFRRIIKCFALHPKITLDFYFYIFKGIYLYGIDIKNHKKLSKIVDDLIDYLKKFEVNNVNREIMFKEQFYFIAKIFVYLSKSLELKKLNKIKSDLCEILTNKNIINKKKMGILLPLYFIFSPDGSVEKNADNNIKMIAQRFKFPENPSLKKINSQNSKEDEDKLNSSGESVSEIFGPNDNNEYDLDQSKAQIELKKELLAKYLVKEKENASKIQKLMKMDNKNDATSIKKSPRKKEKDSLNDKTINKEHREDEIDYLETLSNWDLRKLITINEKFVFSFLDFISNVTAYIDRKNKTVINLLSLFHLEFMTFLLSRRYVKIKYRTIAIKFIHEIYLGEDIKNNEISKELYPNSEEYYQLIQKKIAAQNKSKSDIEEKNSKSKHENAKDLVEIKNENESNEEEGENQNEGNEYCKLNKLNNLKVYLNFLIYELDIIIKVLLDESNKDKIELGIPYLNELILGIKLTGDIFISNDITSYIILWFYEIVKMFLCKSYFFKKFYENIREYRSIDQINFIQEDLNESFYIYEGELTRKNFNIYNKELLFQKLLNEIYAFFKLTNFDVDFKINKIISTYKNLNDKEFNVLCLNNVKEGTGLLTEEKNQDLLPINKKGKEDESEKNFQNLQNIIIDYFKEFTFLPNIVLINLIFTKSNDISIEYKDIFIQYILEIFYHCNDIFGIHSNKLFTIINKILFHDYNTMQIALENNLNKNNITFKSRENLTKREDFKNYDEFLFYNLQKYLQERIMLQLVTVKKAKISNLFLELCCETKSIIQFFQLLGEGHNKSFQTLIVNGKNKNNYPFSSSQIKSYNLSVFHILCQTLKKCLDLINIYSQEEADGELTYDKLILLTENIVQFIIEFFQGTGVKAYIDMYNELKPSLDSIKKIIRLKIPTNPENKRRNFIIVLKIILFDLMSSIIEEGISDLKDCNTLKDIMIIFEPVSLYDEIRTIILSLYQTSNIKSTGVSLEDIKGVDNLIELYKFDENFQKCLELKLSLKIFYFLKILTDVYNREEVIELFKNFEKQYMEIDIYEKMIKRINQANIRKDPEYFHKKSTYKDSINSIIQTPTIKNNIIQKENLEETSIINQNQDKSKKNNIEDNNQEKNKEFHNSNTFNKNQVANNLQSSTTLYYNKDINSNVVNLDKEGLANNKINYVIFLFLSQIMKRIQIKADDKQMGRDFSFFVIPPLCLLLSSSTKNFFVQNVDRETVSTKILSLIDETDYFIFEMFYNKLTMKSFSTIDMKLFNLEFLNIEYLNFLFILIQNILCIIHYFSKDPIDDSAKRKRSIDIIVILIVHILMICFVLFVFFKYKFKLKFKHEIMHTYSEKFIFKKTGDNLHLNHYFSEEDFLSKVGRNLSFKQIIYTGFVKTILYNKQINIYFFTFLFNILFLVHPNAIFLSIPLLLLANINPLLLGIIVSFQMRLKQLIMVLIFMYLIVYLFSWFAFYYFSELFEFEGLLNVKDDSTEEEKLCSSMIQCYLTMLSYGVRSGGGIGDVLPKISYNVSPGYFISGFFFVILFHIFVIWIMINLFFGIIVDTFAALREKTYKIEADKKNTCFICQITRDGAMNKNINFEKHIKNVHNIWNYVYFIAYLHINNEKNFKSLETIVLKKIKEGDTSWLPIGEENCIAN